VWCRKLCTSPFFMLGAHECTFIQPLLCGCCPQDHKCFTIVDHFKGQAPSQILHGQWYLSYLVTFSQALSRSESLMSWTCICLASPNGNCLALRASMCNFVPFICYFCNMPLHPWSKFPTKFPKYTWSNLQTCLSNMVACIVITHNDSWPYGPTTLLVVF
jgi:hypothetical protein